MSLLLLLRSSSYSPDVDLAAYTGDTATPTSQASGVTGSAITAGPGLTSLTVNAIQVAYPASPVYTVAPAATTTSVALAVTNNSYVEFTLTAANGLLDIAAVELEIAKGGSANTRGIGLRASDDGYAVGFNYDGGSTPTLVVQAVRGTTPMEVHRFDTSRIPPSASITFRLYVFAANTANTQDVDNIRPVGSLAGAPTGTAGIPSGEVIGTAGLVQLQVLGSTGLASTGALGADGTVTMGSTSQPVDGAVGLASTGALGVTGGTVQLQAVGTAGLPSDAVVGTAGVITLGVAGTAGVASLGALGSAGATVGLTVTGPTGLASSSVVGTTGTAQLQTAGSAGVPSGEVIGTAGFVGTGLTAAAGIPSAGALGSTGAVVGLTVTDSPGLSSTGQLGTTGATAQLTVQGTAGVPSGEVIGTGSTAGSVTGSTGLPSAAVIGTGTAQLLVADSPGLPSDSQVGTGTTQLQVVGTTGLATGEVIGSGIVQNSSTGSSGIPTGEVIGTAGTASLSVVGSVGLASDSVIGSGSVQASGASYTGTFTGSGVASGTGAAGIITWTVTAARPAGSLVYLGAAGRNVTGTPSGTFTDKTTDTRGNPWTTTFDSRGATYLNVSMWALLQTALQVGDTIVLAQGATPSTNAPVYPPGVSFAGVISPVENVTRAGTEGASSGSHAVVTTTGTDLFVGFWSVEGNSANIIDTPGGQTTAELVSNGTTRFARFGYRIGSPADTTYGVTTSVSYSGLARGYTFTGVVVGQSIPSAGALGTDGSVLLPPQPVTGSAGIASDSVVGSGTVQLGVSDSSGLASTSVVSSGTASLRVIGVAGLPSDGTVGSGTASQGLLVAGLAGIPSAGQVGQGTVQLHIVGTTGIGSGEAFGAPGVLRQLVVGTLGIASALAYGQDGTVGSAESLGLDLYLTAAGPYVVVVRTAGPTAADVATSGPETARLGLTGPRAATLATRGPERAKLVVDGPRT